MADWLGETFSCLMVTKPEPLESTNTVKTIKKVKVLKRRGWVKKGMKRRPSVWLSRTQYEMSQIPVKTRGIKGREKLKQEQTQQDLDRQSVNDEQRKKLLKIMRANKKIAKEIKEAEAKMKPKKLTKAEMDKQKLLSMVELLIKKTILSETAVSV